MLGVGVGVGKVIGEYAFPCRSGGRPPFCPPAASRPRSPTHMNGWELGVYWFKYFQYVIYIYIYVYSYFHAASRPRSALAALGARAREMGGARMGGALIVFGMFMFCYVCVIHMCIYIYIYIYIGGALNALGAQARVRQSEVCPHRCALAGGQF